MASRRGTGKSKLGGAAAKGVLKALDNVLVDGKKVAGDVADAVKTPKPRAKPDAPVEPKPKRKREIPQNVLDNWNRGTQFNKEREPYYRARGGGNELHLDNGKVVDSYVPGKEIVSRKHTQLVEVETSTALRYVRELDDKYSPGTVVKDTPHAREQIGDHAGKEMSGALILEVPPQNREVPKPVLDEADRLDISIRDTNGKVYEPKPED